MAIDDTLNAGINLNFQAGGGQSFADLAAKLVSMKDALAITKKELQEAGSKGSIFMKETLDSTQAVRNADAMLKAYSATVKKWGENSAQATTAQKQLKSALSDVAAETQALNAKTQDLNTKSQGFFSGIASNGVASMAKWAAGMFSVYQVFNYLKNAINDAVAFDSKLDKLAVSGQRFGLSFQEASNRMYNLAFDVSKTGGYDINGNTGAQSSYSAEAVVEAMTKLRDRGIDVFSMTKEQVIPALDAAKATAQDLAPTTDAMAVAMQQFNLTADDTARVADVMVGSFQAAGLSAEEFQSGIQAAGVAARMSGTSLEEYVAVLTRLKQLGMDGNSFQKLFFASLNAPSAKQLQVLDRRGVNQYVSSSAYGTAGALQATSGIGALGEFATSMGFGGIGNSLSSARLSAARALEGMSAPLKEQTQAVEEQQEKLIDLADAQDRLTGSITTYTRIVDIEKSQLDSLKEAQSGWKDKLEDTTEALAVVKEQFGQLADPRISGMASFDAKIAQAEIALKKQQLALLQSADGTRAYEDRIRSLTGEMHDQERALQTMRQRYDEVGASLDKAKSKASEYEQKLAALRNQELKGEGAFTETQFALQQRISQLQLQKSRLSPVDLFGANRLDQQIAALQRQLEQSRLEQSVTFDPQRHAIEQAANRAEERTGKRGAPGTADEIISQIESYAEKLEHEQERIKKLTKEHDREAEAIASKSQEIEGLKGSIESAKAAMDSLSESTKAAEDALNELKLEREVQYAEQLQRIKEETTKWKAELGLIAKEKPYDEIIREIGVVGQQYVDLQAQRDIEKQKVDEYQTQIDDASLSLHFYERKLADAKQSSDDLTKEIKAAEEQFAAMPKVYKDEIQLLDDMAASGFTAGDAYDYLGKRGGAALAALIGEKGENAGKLRDLADALGKHGTATASAKDASMGAADAIEAFKASLQNFNVQLGTVVADKMGGLADALTKLTNILLDSPLFGEDYSEGQAKLTPEAAEWAREHGKNVTPDGIVYDKSAGAGWWPSWLTIPDMTSHALGGTVPGYGYNDSEFALLTPGERVLTKQEARSYASGAGGVTVNITGPVSIRSEDDIRRLSAAISRELHSEVRRVRSGMPA